MLDPSAAGSTLNLEGSAAKSLFLGNILEENLFPYPTIEPDEADTLRMVLESIDKFMEPREEEYRQQDITAEQSGEYLQSLRELGLFSIIIPEHYDGFGLSNAA